MICDATAKIPSSFVRIGRSYPHNSCPSASYADGGGMLIVHTDHVREKTINVCDDSPIPSEFVVTDQYANNSACKTKYFNSQVMLTLSKPNPYPQTTLVCRGYNKPSNFIIVKDSINSSQQCRGSSSVGYLDEIMQDPKTVTPTPTPIATPTPVPTATPTAVATPSPTPSIPSATPTPIVVPTPTSAPTATPIISSTPTPVGPATPTPKPTPSPTATPQTRCALSANLSTVNSGQSVVLTVTGSNLPAGAQGYWYGTKNGVVDVNGVGFGAVPASISQVNNIGSHGIYTRRVEIRNAQGQAICSTNSVQAEFLAPPLPVSCALSADISRVSLGQSINLTVTGSNIPAGAQGYWYGTKNGVVDANGIGFGSVPSRVSLTNTSGSQGVYTRKVEIRNAQGQAICTTSSVQAEFLAPPPPPPPQPSCYLSANTRHVRVGEAVVITLATGNLPAGAQGYWYGTKNGITDVNAQNVGTMPNTFSFTNVAGAQGTYMRYIQIRDAQNQPICTTPQAITEFLSY
jgi:hypothetical protein